MFKNAKVMFIYTETSLHCGSGTSLGVIDLPIQREKYTDYPVCQASGIKGVIREWFDVKYGDRDEKIKYTFGPDFGRGESEAHAGAATFTDGKLLLFPVRSLYGVFAYTTSVFALSRLKRDLELAGVKVAWNIPQDPGKVLGVTESKAKTVDNKVVLEEYTFDFQADDSVKKIAEWIAGNAISQGEEYEFWREKVKNDLFILPENAFRDFVKFSTEVQARIRINNATKTVDKWALFYEEALPCDSLLYSVVLAHDPTCDKANRPPGLQGHTEVMNFISKIDGNRLQFGGDTTIGRGIVNVNFLNGRIVQ